MIESKILGSAVGIQRQDVIDNTETNVLPSLANGVIVGRFKRGRMDKPFKVTADDYRSLLGHDPSNLSYMAVEDAFARGIEHIYILMVGTTWSKAEPPIKPPVEPPIKPPVEPPIKPPVEPKPTAPPPPTDAITSASGWYLKDHFMIGELVYLNAVRQTSAGGLKSSISITATSAELVQYLLSGNGYDATNKAVSDLIGESVPWYLDKESQKFEYTITT